MIVISRLDGDLRPAPGNPSWIRVDKPMARSAVIATRESVGSSTIVWECTAGTFDWKYRIDETVYILEGSVVIQTDTMRPTRYGPGDVIFLMCGARARWPVEDCMRKLAFCRRPAPRLLRVARAVWHGIEAMRPPPGELDALGEPGFAPPSARLSSILDRVAFGRPTQQAAGQVRDLAKAGFLQQHRRLRGARAAAANHDDRNLRREFLGVRDQLLERD